MRNIQEVTDWIRIQLTCSFKSVRRQRNWSVFWATDDHFSCFISLLKKLWTSQKYEEEQRLIYLYVMKGTHFGSKPDDKWSDYVTQMHSVVENALINNSVYFVNFVVVILSDD